MTLLPLLAATAGAPSGPTWPDPPADPPPGGGGGGSTPPLRWDGSTTIKVTVWGNSHYAIGSGAGLENVGGFKAVRDAAGAIAANLAVGGRTWRAMRDHAADVIASWSPLHDHNVLVVGENTNSIFGGSDGYTPRTTQAQVLADAHDALDPVLAAHPWTVLLCSTIPRGGTPAYATPNALAQSVDTYMGTHLAEFGADGFVNFRSSNWFNGDGTSYTSDTWQWMGSVGKDWDYLPPPYIHPAGEPYIAMADLIGDGLTALATP